MIKQKELIRWFDESIIDTPDCIIELFDGYLEYGYCVNPAIHDYFFNKVDKMDERDILRIMANDSNDILLDYFKASIHDCDCDSTLIELLRGCYFRYLYDELLGVYHDELLNYVLIICMYNVALEYMDKINNISELDELLNDIYYSMDENLRFLEYDIYDITSEIEERFEGEYDENDD